MYVSNAEAQIKADKAGKGLLAIAGLTQHTYSIASTAIAVNDNKHEIQAYAKIEAEGKKVQDMYATGIDENYEKITDPIPREERVKAFEEHMKAFIENEITPNYNSRVTKKLKEGKFAVYMEGAKSNINTTALLQVKEENEEMSASELSQLEIADDIGVIARARGFGLPTDSVESGGNTGLSFSNPARGVEQEDIATPIVEKNKEYNEADEFGKRVILYREVLQEQHPNNPELVEQKIQEALPRLINTQIARDIKANWNNNLIQLKINDGEVDGAVDPDKNVNYNAMVDLLTDQTVNSSYGGNELNEVQKEFAKTQILALTETKVKEKLNMLDIVYESNVAPILNEWDKLSYKYNKEELDAVFSENGFDDNLSYGTRKVYYDKEKGYRMEELEDNYFASLKSENPEDIKKALTAITASTYFNESQKMQIKNAGTSEELKIQRENDDQALGYGTNYDPQTSRALGVELKSFKGTFIEWKEHVESQNAGMKRSESEALIDNYKTRKTDENYGESELSTNVETEALTKLSSDGFVSKADLETLWKEKGLNPNEAGNRSKIDYIFNKGRTEERTRVLNGYFNAVDSGDKKAQKEYKELIGNTELFEKEEAMGLETKGRALLEKMATDSLHEREGYGSTVSEGATTDIEKKMADKEYSSFEDFEKDLSLVKGDITYEFAEELRSAYFLGVSREDFIEGQNLEKYNTSVNKLDMKGEEYTLDDLRKIAEDSGISAEKYGKNLLADAEQGKLNKAKKYYAVDAATPVIKKMKEAGFTYKAGAEATGMVLSFDEKGEPILVEEAAVSIDMTKGKEGSKEFSTIVPPNGWKMAGKAKFIEEDLYEEAVTNHTSSQLGTTQDTLNTEADKQAKLQIAAAQELLLPGKDGGENVQSKFYKNWLLTGTKGFSKAQILTQADALLKDKSITLADREQLTKDLDGDLWEILQGPVISKANENKTKAINRMYSTNDGLATIVNAIADDYILRALSELPIKEDGEYDDSVYADIIKTGQAIALNTDLTRIEESTDGLFFDTNATDIWNTTKLGFSGEQTGWGTYLAERSNGKFRYLESNTVKGFITKAINQFPPFESTAKSAETRAANAEMVLTQLANDYDYIMTGATPEDKIKNMMKTDPAIANLIIGTAREVFAMNDIKEEFMSTHPGMKVSPYARGGQLGVVDESGTNPVNYMFQITSGGVGKAWVATNKEGTIIEASRLLPGGIEAQTKALYESVRSQSSNIIQSFIGLESRDESLGISVDKEHNFNEMKAILQPVYQTGLDELQKMYNLQEEQKARLSGDKPIHKRAELQLTREETGVRVSIIWKDSPMQWLSTRKSGGR